MSQLWLEGHAVLAQTHMIIRICVAYPVWMKELFQGPRYCHIDHSEKSIFEVHEESNEKSEVSLIRSDRNKNSSLLGPNSKHLPAKLVILS